MHVCKICKMELPSKKALVYHLSSKTHKKQSVYCPWCNVKNVITRVTDLKVHCSSKHFVELGMQPKNFIGGNNCFYFAVFPEDYVDIFKPEPWENQMAVEARRLMINMTERVGMSLQERDKIRAGWKQVKETLVSSGEKDSKVRKRINSEKPEDVKEVYEKLFTAAPLKLAAREDRLTYDSDKVVIQPKKKVKFNTEISTESKKDETNNKHLSQSQTVKLDAISSTHNNKATDEKLETHKSKKSVQNKEQRQHGHDSKPTSNRTEKHNNINSFDGKQSESRDENNNTNMKDINTDLEDENEDDIQTIIKLETGRDGIRRLITLKQMINEGERTNKEKESSEKMRSTEEEVVMDEGRNEDMKKSCARKVINDGEIEDVREAEGERVDNEENLKENVTNARTNVEEIEGIVEINDDEVMKDDEIENMIEEETNEMINVQDTNIMGKEKDVDIVEEVSMRMSEKGDADYDMEAERSDCESENYDENMNEKDMASVWKNWNMERPQAKADKVREGERSIKFKITDGKVRRVIEKTKMTETEKAVELLLEKELREECIEMNDKAEMVQVQTPKKHLQEHKKTQTFSERAISLLNRGAMPLCPPGRRDWGSVIVPLIIPVGETSFSWPPFGWQNMSADRKLLEWEAASWKLECLTNGFVPANMTRRYLLDKYMFLALPGSSGPKVETTEKSCSASRAFLYKMLQELASGERQPTKAEEDHITTLEYLVSSELSQPIDLNSIQVPLTLSRDKAK